MIYAVIMAGGSGTRFWPQSRRNKPKQLLNIAGEKTMIRATVERLVHEIPFHQIMVVTAESHAEVVRSQVPELDPDMVVAEPQGRNTAPCIALAAFKLYKKDPDAVMVVLPADHLIRREKEFLKALRMGVEAASRGEYLLTFGIVPVRPETGYGYVKLGTVILEVGSTAVYEVDRFAEKPDISTAQEYVTSGRYMWNSGMFVWKAAHIINAFDTHLPAVSTAMREILPVLNTPEESRALPQTYDKVQAVSIDYGIMEKAGNVVCLPIDVDWNDVGSWASIDGVWERDSAGNAIRGEVVSLHSENCIVSSPHKLTALVGAKDLIVVDTGDALLICAKQSAQDVRELQEILKARGYDHLL